MCFIIVTGKAGADRPFSARSNRMGKVLPTRFIAGQINDKIGQTDVFILLSCIYATIIYNYRRLVK
jgi:hypothetical protein